MDQKLFKCNNCKSTHQSLYCYCRLHYKCDDPKILKNETLAYTQVDDKLILFLCSNCYDEKMIAEPCVQKVIQQQKEKLQLDYQKYQKYQKIIQTIQAKTIEIKSQISLDIQSNIKDLEKNIDKSFDEVHKEFLLNDIQNTKSRIQDVERVKEQFIALNKVLLQDDSLSINDANKFYEMQIQKFQLKEKEELYAFIQKFLPEQFNPQNQ